MKNSLHSQLRIILNREAVIRPPSFLWRHYTQQGVTDFVNRGSKQGLRKLEKGLKFVVHLCMRHFDQQILQLQKLFGLLPISKILADTLC